MNDDRKLQAEEQRGEERLRREKEKARGSGYTGDLCQTCGNFTMRRNGSCLVCATCGSTTGCS
jgi:ribonucleoside-diphosphate reductase alpha chain